MSAKSLLFISLSGSDSSLPPSRFEEIGRAGDELTWVEELLGSLGVLNTISYKGVRAYKYEPIPDPGDFDAVILGGSYHSVNDRFPWQLDAMRWIAEYRSTGRPLLGICGGHQMMCYLQGSAVEPLAERPYAGSFPLELSDAGRQHFLFDDMPSNPVFHYANSEHVVQPPKDTVVLGSAPTFEAAALDHGDNWLSVQFHPEMAHDVIAVDFKFIKPELVEQYYPLPDAPKLLRNFLLGTGVLN